jgi:hypothetical protein
MLLSLATEGRGRGQWGRSPESNGAAKGEASYFQKNRDVITDSPFHFDYLPVATAAELQVQDLGLFLIKS